MYLIKCGIGWLCIDYYTTIYDIAKKMSIFIRNIILSSDGIASSCKNALFN